MDPRVIFSIGMLLLTFQSVPSLAAGQLTYGDKCSVQSAVLQVLSLETDNSQKCKTEVGLICTGTCTCPPTRVWDRGFLFGLLGGGSCVVGANGPCGGGARCVANAACGANIPLCFCNEGYYAHDLQCISRGVFSINAGTPSITTGSLISASFMLLVQYVLNRPGGLQNII